MNIILDKIEQLKNEFVELRHDLHQYPELGYQEHRTSDIIVQKLEQSGYQVHQGLAQTGIVGTLKVGNGSKVLGIRADIDALPMQELSGQEWSSRKSGCFHGCGHDGHTAILLYAAKYLAKNRSFNGTLNVIFQPAEELLYGGKEMLDDGLFKLFPCDAIFSLHNMPGHKKGSFHFRKGALMASSDTLEVVIKGVGGHGAIPEKSIDSTLIACHIGVALQTITSRNVSPFDPTVVTIGSIQAGEVANIINAKARMLLSVRTLTNENREKVLLNIERIIKNQAKSFGGIAEIKHLNSCPVLINGDIATEFAISVAKELVGDEMVNTNTSQLMGSEDFAFMLDEHPNGCYLMLGAGEEQPMVHNPAYDFNDDLLSIGAAYWCRLAEKYLS